jgi:hypothetical protein
LVGLLGVKSCDEVTVVGTDLGLINNWLAPQHNPFGPSANLHHLARGHFIEQAEPILASFGG